MKRYLNLQVLQDESMSGPITVEQVLKKQAMLTKRQISRAKFSPEGILKNGMRCRVTERVNCGDSIRVCVETEEETSSHIEENHADIHILYEDVDILLVNKPAGLVTHPQGMHYNDTLVNRTAAYFRKKGEEHCIRPVGRLDKDTSGIVVIAKNRLAASRLQKQREENIFKKTYLAMVCGELPEDGLIHRIEEPIGPDPDDRLKMKITPDGKNAITWYQVLQSKNDKSIVSLTLETGRTHQIRVHMAGIGHPLWGDPLYGKKTVQENRFAGDNAGTRACLHAWKVELQQPLTGERLEFEAKEKYIL